MSGYSWEKTLDVALDAQTELVPSTPQLEHAVTNSKQKGLPHIAVSAAHGRLLAIFCQLVDAKNVLEVGTLGGYSTIWLATSVPGVKVTSLEFDPKHRDVALENTEGLGNVDIRLGAALDNLPKIEAEGTVFDLVFIDADWDNQSKYFDWAVKLTRKGGVVFVDNVLRMMGESDLDGQGFISQIKADKRVEATLMPYLSTQKTLLEEAIDGYIIAKVQ